MMSLQGNFSNLSPQQQQQLAMAMNLRSGEAASPLAADGAMAPGESPVFTGTPATDSFTASASMPPMDAAPYGAPPAATDGGFGWGKGLAATGLGLTAGGANQWYHQSQRGKADEAKTEAQKKLEEQQKKVDEAMTKVDGEHKLDNGKTLQQAKEELAQLHKDNEALTKLKLDGDVDASSIGEESVVIGNKTFKLDGTLQELTHSFEESDPYESAQLVRNQEGSGYTLKLNPRAATEEGGKTVPAYEYELGQDGKLKAQIVDGRRLELDENGTLKSIQPRVNGYTGVTSDTLFDYISSAHLEGVDDVDNATKVHFNISENKSGSLLKPKSRTLTVQGGKFDGSTFKLDSSGTIIDIPSFKLDGKEKAAGYNGYNKMLGNRSDLPEEVVNNLKKHAKYPSETDKVVENGFEAFFDDTSQFAHHNYRMALNENNMWLSPQQSRHNLKAKQKPVSSTISELEAAVEEGDKAVTAKLDETTKSLKGELEKLKNSADEAVKHFDNFDGAFKGPWRSVAIGAGTALAAGGALWAFGRGGKQPQTPPPPQSMA